MALNAILAYRVLNRIIDVRLESPSVRNILVASTMMGLFVAVYRLAVPLSSVWLTLVPVAVGAAIYGVVLLKLDRAFMTNSMRWLRRWLRGCRGGCRCGFVLASAIPQRLTQPAGGSWRDCVTY